MRLPPVVNARFFACRARHEKKASEEAPNIEGEQEAQRTVFALYARQRWCAAWRRWQKMLPARVHAATSPEYTRRYEGASTRYRSPSSFGNARATRVTSVPPPPRGVRAPPRKRRSNAVRRAAS